MRSKGFQVKASRAYLKKLHKRQTHTYSREFLYPYTYICTILSIYLYVFVYVRREKPAEQVASCRPINDRAIGSTSLHSNNPMCCDVEFDEFSSAHLIKTNHF